jgi:hypothetical protein
MNAGETPEQGRRGKSTRTRIKPEKAKSFRAARNIWAGENDVKALLLLFKLLKSNDVRAMQRLCAERSPRKPESSATN